MNRISKAVLGVSLAVAGFGIVQTGIAAEQKGPVAIRVEDAGVDYKLQGEYEGTSAGAKVGVQVVALGNGEFNAVIHKGGLPGAGWDKSEKKEIKGKLEGGKAVFQGFAADGEKLAGADIEAKKVVRESPTLGAKPPAGATVLFDGTNVDAWRPGAKMDDRKFLEAASGPTTKQEFGDCTLHVEFLLPFMPNARGQGRANSGVYLQRRYEVQVLDSFGLKGEDNECGGIYKNAAPLVNMCLPPLQWQTYDIEFTTPKFVDGKKTANATLTVKHNGVVIHDKLEIKDKTGGGQAEGAALGPIFLQNHGNPVFYRNIWVVTK